MSLAQSSSRPASVSSRSAIPSEPPRYSSRHPDSLMTGSSSSASTATATPTGALPPAISSSPPFSAPRRMPGLGAETWRRLRATSRRTPVPGMRSLSSRATPSLEEGTSVPSGPQLPRPPSLTIHSDPPTVPQDSYDADRSPPRGPTDGMDKTESESALFTSPRQAPTPQAVQPSVPTSTMQRTTSTTSTFGDSHGMEPTFSSQDSHVRPNPKTHAHSNSEMTLVHSGSFGLEVQPSSTSLSTRAASSLLCTPGSHGTHTTASDGSDKQGTKSVGQSHEASIKTSVAPSTELSVVNDQATSAQSHVAHQISAPPVPVPPTITLQSVRCDGTCEAPALRDQLQALMEDHARLSRVCAEAATTITLLDGQLQQSQAQLVAANTNAEMWAAIAKQAQKSALEDTLRSVPARLEQLLKNVGYVPPATAPTAPSHVPTPALQPPQSASTMQAAPRSASTMQATSNDEVGATFLQEPRLSAGTSEGTFRGEVSGTPRPRASMDRLPNPLQQMLARAQADHKRLEQLASENMVDSSASTSLSPIMSVGLSTAQNKPRCISAPGVPPSVHSAPSDCSGSAPRAMSATSAPAAPLYRNRHSALLQPHVPSKLGSGSTGSVGSIGSLRGRFHRRASTMADVLAQDEDLRETADALGSQPDHRSRPVSFQGVPSESVSSHNQTFASDASGLAPDHTNYMISSTPLRSTPPVRGWDATAPAVSPVMEESVRHPGVSVPVIVERVSSSGNVAQDPFPATPSTGREVSPSVHEREQYVERYDRIAARNSLHVRDEHLFEEDEQNRRSDPSVPSDEQHDTPPYSSTPRYPSRQDEASMVPAPKSSTSPLNAFESDLTHILQRYRSQRRSVDGATLPDADLPVVEDQSKSSALHSPEQADLSNQSGHFTRHIKQMSAPIYPSSSPAAASPWVSGSAGSATRPTVVSSLSHMASLTQKAKASPESVVGVRPQSSLRSIRSNGSTRSLRKRVPRPSSSASSSSVHDSIPTNARDLFAPFESARHPSSPTTFKTSPRSPLNPQGHRRNRHMDEDEVEELLGESYYNEPHGRRASSGSGPSTGYVSAVSFSPTFTNTPAHSLGPTPEPVEYNDLIAQSPIDPQLHSPLNEQQGPEQRKTLTEADLIAHRNMYRCLAKELSPQDLRMFEALVHGYDQGVLALDGPEGLVVRVKLLLFGDPMLLAHDPQKYSLRVSLAAQFEAACRSVQG